jgi:hypothetical protein
MATATCDKWNEYSHYYCSTAGIATVKKCETCSVEIPPNCLGSGLIYTISDECIDDWGTSAGGDNLEIYCVNGIPRFCLSNENCKWR